MDGARAGRSDGGGGNGGRGSGGRGSGGGARGAAASGRGRRGEAGKGERVADWADGRLGLYGIAKANLRKVFPDHWSFMLGEICLYSFLILILTGVYLTLFFEPSGVEVEYNGTYEPLNGVLMTRAYESTLEISFDVRGGLLIRQIHHWAALVFVAGMLIHMMRVFFTGAFRKPRELNWLFGWTLLFLGIITGLTGYSLPDDLLSGTGIRFAQGAILSVPVVGTYLSFFLFGGEFPGHDIISRLFPIHVLLLPGIMLGLVVAHLILVFYHKHTQYPGPGRDQKSVVGMPFMPVYMAKAGGFFFLVFGVLTFMGAIATINPVWAFGPYRPDLVTTGAQPDWYLGFSEGLIRVMPGWEINAFGHTLVLGVFIPFSLFPLIMLAIGVYPFVEAWITGDKREHHILDRPRNVPVRTGLGVAWLSLYGVLLIGGGNDIVATRLHLSINAITWFVRIGFFVVPVVAFIVTKRICLGLQLRDRDKVLHGRETGIIKRLPHGEYVEVHEPLSQARLFTLTQHEQDPPYEIGPRVDAHGVRRRVRPTDRLRARLARAVFGPGTRIEKPTAKEYRELTSSDHHH
ncbi:cytochrome bc complex cytochrome b subunit [Streptomyces ipomoeae]|jgi:ubiquinol-cytochrome c reductase cytochrome b subunit|uniref:Cytochrome bc1 complex cytochrome b subunit n=1 Tax=Streptomyces ipomoeae TaxID=103232 RepID=A0AAE9AZ41_9ACTN|nr:cytochrome bc complex cytochrome b subunit [Streptomyces ipomoeae]MDX2698941.1 cytochrome bc complex cytochrome b subunit [Streptomyces ipomoeae]MDX2826270.1 cytochrome bc complex cytochrome b subunit [Streptomyces ipomoeae]MDX2844551.1 cytochrome bc complex cytochrome b subunit [Streptomyces ipomoeae]MDX2878382.1 cytochrome bc complex cytochrome b subunit [Streptomyces ipomoeae]TQE23177.1 cytochrome bc complex cytochrome b subunit [Streptomyces ipomoeae]